MQALLAANWKPHDAFDDASPMIVEHAVQLIDRGDLAGARGIIGLVDEAPPMLGARADKRFAPLLATDPAAFDLEALGARKMAKIEAATAGAPGLLAGVNEKASALVNFGHFDAALKLLDEALAKAQPTDGTASAYVDAQAELAATLATRARALAGLGRYDEALATLTRAASRPEAGHINVTQRVALAQLQVAMGKAKERSTPSTPSSPSDLTPAARCAIAGVRVCAETAAGDTAAARAALDVVRARRDVAPNAFVEASLCADDMDAAAAAVIAQLDSPQRRLAILAWAQTLKLPPAPPGPPPQRRRAPPGPPRPPRRASRHRQSRPHRLRAAVPDAVLRPLP